MDRVSTQHARAQISESLNIGGRAFVRLFDARSGRLMEGVRILAGDFALRGAVATRDRDTILSALANHGARIGANVGMLVSLDNLLLVNTLQPQAAPAPFPFTRLTEIAQLNGQAGSIVFLGDRMFQLVVVPVYAPDPIAWVAMGFRVDENVQELRTITSAHVSFLRADPDTGEWSVVATTLPPELRDGLHTATAVQRHRPERAVRAGPRGWRVRDARAAARRRGRFARGSGAATIARRGAGAVLPPAAVADRADRWGLLVSLAGSVVLARRVTQPVAVLVEGAREIGNGKYDHPVTVKQQDELGELAGAINHMAQGIAEREGRIRYLAYHDELTGLPNRVSLEEHLQPRAGRAGTAADDKVGLLVMALDRFNDINHTLGFQVGDRVLQHVGRRLQELAGAGNLVARLDGGQFAVVLHKVRDIEHALEQAHTIQRNLEAPFRIDDQPFEFGTHIGVALYPTIPAMPPVSSVMPRRR